MKTKILLVVVLLSAATVTRVHAFGLGAQFNFSAGSIFAPGAALAISPSDMTHLAVNWYLDLLDGEKSNIVGLTLDVRPLDLPITTFSAGSFDFTLGVGLFGNLVFIEGENPGFNAGLRVPIGFSLFLAQKVFEIYTHVAPSWGVDFLPSLGFSKPFFPIALGLKIWFR